MSERHYYKTFISAVPNFRGLMKIHIAQINFGGHDIPGLQETKKY